MSTLLIRDHGPALATPATWAAVRDYALGHPLTNRRPDIDDDRQAVRLPGGWIVLVSANK